MWFLSVLVGHALMPALPHGHLVHLPILRIAGGKQLSTVVASMSTW